MHDCKRGIFMQQPGIVQMLGEMVIPGFLIVMLTLVILIFCVMLLSRVIKEIEKKNSVPPPTPPTPKKPEPVVSAPATLPTPSTAPMIQASAPPPSGESTEVIAVISAAIASVMEIPYTITSVTPAAPVAAVAAPDLAANLPAAAERRRPVWGFAGMQQNTRPF